MHFPRCYAHPRGVAKDWVQAAAWYGRAAEQGDAEAQHNLGACYKLGDGVAADRERALAWCRPRFEQDPPP